MSLEKSEISFDRQSYERFHNMASKMEENIVQIHKNRDTLNRWLVGHVKRIFNESFGFEDVPIHIDPSGNFRVELPYDNLDYDKTDSVCINSEFCNKILENFGFLEFEISFMEEDLVHIKFSL